MAVGGGVFHELAAPFHEAAVGADTRGAGARAGDGFDEGLGVYRKVRRLALTEASPGVRYQRVNGEGGGVGRRGGGGG
jgi:hypothetical protein